MKNTKSLPEMVVDTSTFFSAIYNRSGNEARLFEMADKGRCRIIISTYVLEELEVVFRRKGMDFEMVLDLLDTYENIWIEEIGEIEDSEVKAARELISDPKDRPIFVFAHRRIKEYESAYLVSGDRVFFGSAVLRELDNRVLRTREALELLKNL